MDSHMYGPHILVFMGGSGVVEGMSPIFWIFWVWLKDEPYILVFRVGLKA